MALQQNDRWIKQRIDDENPGHCLERRSRWRELQSIADDAEPDEQRSLDHEQRRECPGGWIDLREKCGVIHDSRPGPLDREHRRYRSAAIPASNPDDNDRRRVQPQPECTQPKGMVVAGEYIKELVGSEWQIHGPCSSRVPPRLPSSTDPREAATQLLPH